MPLVHFGSRGPVPSRQGSENMADWYRPTGDCKELFDRSGLLFLYPNAGNFLDGGRGWISRASLIILSGPNAMTPCLGKSRANSRWGWRRQETGGSSGRVGYQMGILSVIIPRWNLNHDLRVGNQVADARYVLLLAAGWTIVSAVVPKRGWMEGNS